jgi:tRNA(Arg) A34 adenosine deaminase TadA
LLHAGVGEWEALEEPWRECLQLAWDAYRAGTVPVGAIVVDANGRVVARGRDRIFEAQSTDGSLAGTRLAHAEVNALAQLPVTARYFDHTLYSALEPCLLCVGAAAMSTVGSIRYAAADPSGGACHAEIAFEELVRRKLVIEGPYGGWAAELAQALSVAFWLTRERRYDWIVDSHGREAERAAKRVLALGDPGPRLADALPRLLDAVAV